MDKAGGRLAALGLIIATGVGFALWALQGVEGDALEPLDASLDSHSTSEPVELGGPSPSAAQTSTEPENDPPRAAVASPTDAIAQRLDVYAGYVVDPDGEPIAGAVVGLHRVDEGIDTPALKSTVSLEDGSFLLQADKGWMRVKAQAPGYGPGVKRLRASETIELMLPFATQVHGVVRDATTGFPIGGATILCDRGDVPSGSDGSYRLEGVAVGMNHFRVWAQGYAGVMKSINIRDRTPVELDLELTRGQPIEIAVVDRDHGHPLPGAHIDRFYGDDVETDASGRVRIWVTEGCDIRLTASKDEYISLHWSWTPTSIEIAPRTSAAACAGRVDRRPGTRPRREATA